MIAELALVMTLVAGPGPTVDGILSDPCWDRLGATEFGEIGSLWATYDAENLYLASIVDAGTLARRLKPVHLMKNERIELHVILPEWNGRSLRAVAHPTETTKTFWHAGPDSPFVPATPGVRMPGAYREKRCILEIGVAWKTLELTTPPRTILISLGFVPEGTTLSARRVALHLNLPDLSPTPTMPKDELQVTHQQEYSPIIIPHPSFGTMLSLVGRLDVASPKSMEAMQRELGRYPAPEVLAAIRQWSLTPSRTATSRAHAIQLLEHTEDPHRYDVMLEIAATDANPALLAAAVHGLKGAQGRDALLRAIVHGATPGMRRTALALVGIAKLTDPAVFPVLEQAIMGERDSALRVQAVRIADQLDDPRVLPALEQAMRTDAEPAVRLAIAQALGSMLDPRTVSSLMIAVRQDSSPHVREEAVLALGRLNDPSAIPALQAALHDDHVRVRDAAAQVLQKLK